MLGSNTLTCYITGGSYFAGIITGNGNLIKHGYGILALSAPSTLFTGSISILNGELGISNNSALPNINSIFISSDSTLGLENGLTLNSGQTLSRNGIIFVGDGSIIFDSGSILAPDTIYMSIFNNQIWNGGFIYKYFATNFTNIYAGGCISGEGSIDIAATTLNPCIIDLYSPPGGASNFDNATAYYLPLVDWFGTITNFDSSKFIVNTTNFSNMFTGTFSVAMGVDIGQLPTVMYLVYTPA